MTIQSAETLDSAARLASEQLHQFIMQACKLKINQTGMLMSLLAHMTICQVVDPLKTVRMSFPIKVLEQYGYRLP
jgi:amidase